MLTQNLHIYVSSYVTVMLVPSEHQHSNLHSFQWNSEETITTPFISTFWRFKPLRASTAEINSDMRSVTCIFFTLKSYCLYPGMRIGPTPFPTRFCICKVAHSILALLIRTGIVFVSSKPLTTFNHEKRWRSFLYLQSC